MDAEEQFAFIVHLRSEHQQLNERLTSIDDGWSNCKPGPSVLDATRQVLRRLEELRAELAHHFTEEDEGGCLDQAACRSPSLAAEIAQIEREHPALLAEVDEIIGQMRESQDLRTPPRAELQQCYRSFVERLRAHETAETRLLERGLGIPSD